MKSYIIVELEKIEKEILKGRNIEEMLENFDWKNFEEIVREIFESNGFKVKGNFRFKTKRRYEIDAIASKDNITFCVDCKKWGKGRYKKSSLKYAVENQEKRTKELGRFLKRNPIAKESLKVNIKQLFSLVVTMLQEDVIKEGNTFIVPVWKLNSFLLEVEKYMDTDQSLDYAQAGT